MSLTSQVEGVGVDPRSAVQAADLRVVEGEGPGVDVWERKYGDQVVVLGRYERENPA